MFGGYSASQIGLETDPVWPKTSQDLVLDKPGCIALVIRTI